VTIEQFAYLKTPDKVRAAMINCIGHAPPMSAIEKALKKIEARKPIRIIGEPTDADGIDYRVNVKPTRAPARSLSQIERRKLAPKPMRKVNATLPSYQPNEYTKKLVKQICKKMCLDEVTFYSKSRWKEYVMARAIAVRLLRERNPALYSFAFIARCIGRGDHSTAHHLYNQFDIYAEHYPAVKAVYEELRNDN
jgi:hypothetical protein